MLTTIMKCVAILTLPAAMFRDTAPNLGSYPDFVITTAAVLDRKSVV